MSFTISSFVADANNNVVSVDWKYENADGSVSNTHVLAVPPGSVPLPTVTQDVLVSWLEDQLSNTAEELDAYLAKVKAQVEYQAGFVKYERKVDNTYAVPAETETADA